MTLAHGQLATFTTTELLQLSGMTRVQLQRLENAGVLKPLTVGYARTPSKWSPMQVVAAAYFMAFADANCNAAWSYAACRWVARQHPGNLRVQMADKKRTLLMLSPTGEGRIVEPYLKPNATREHRLMVAKLDLKPIYERIMRRADEMAEELAKGGD